jgi:hypothetical protein
MLTPGRREHGTRRVNMLIPLTRAMAPVGNFIVVNGTGESNSFCRLDLRRLHHFLGKFSPDRE